ncbi:DUF6801 domain-containing protein [Nonomuraea sp. NPDC049152]|uniref:DUF6801 domain-containing protein n=1 Tax=Nonomuraea sp. NPDC049152 TaxID=3154350 RepID=UPI0034102161
MRAHMMASAGRTRSKAVAAAGVTALTLLGGPGAKPHPPQPVPTGTTARHAPADVTCALPVLGGKPFAIDVTGTVPPQLASRQAFDMTTERISLTIPADTVDALRGLRASSVDGSITALRVTATNATPPFLDIADGATLLLPRAPLNEGQPAVMALPVPPRIGPWVAAGSGAVTIDLVSSGFSLNLYNAYGGNVAKSLPVVCQGPLPSHAIATTNIVI